MKTAWIILLTFCFALPMSALEQNHIPIQGEWNKSALNSFVTVQKLTGVVYDADRKEPVINANVYLDGTSYYTITDMDGRFELTIDKEVNTRLVISYVGYEKIVMNMPFIPLPDTLFLKERAAELDEVIVFSDRGAYKYSREKKMEAFLTQFLGNTQAGRQCSVLNEDDILLLYDSENKTLTATADKPIQVMNNYLGYMMLFDLKEFRVHYIDRTLNDASMNYIYYAGTSTFVNTSNQDIIIREHRQEVYNGSIKNFISHLYNRTLNRSDFVFRTNGIGVASRNCFSVVDSLSQVWVELKPAVRHTPPSAFIIPEFVNTDKQQSIAGYVEVWYKGQTSYIIFYTDKFQINASRIVSPVDKIVFYGAMGEQRIGNMLPLDYIPQ